MKQRERQMGKEELQLKAVYNRLEKLSQHLEKKLALVPKDKHDIYLESSAKIVKKLLNIHQRRSKTLDSSVGSPQLGIRLNHLFQLDFC
jgi:hypothetical protein